LPTLGRTKRPARFSLEGADFLGLEQVAAIIKVKTTRASGFAMIDDQLRVAVRAERRRGQRVIDPLPPSFFGPPASHVTRRTDDRRIYVAHRSSLIDTHTYASIAVVFDGEASAPRSARCAGVALDCEAAEALPSRCREENRCEYEPTEYRDNPLDNHWCPLPFARCARAIA